MLRMSDQQWHKMLLLLQYSTSLDGHAIGFMPLSAFEDAARRGDVQTVSNNGELVGYALTKLHRVYPSGRIYIAWVRPDARMLLHGKALVKTVSDRAIRHGKSWLFCDVADDLPANVFWESLGFVCYGHKRAGWSGYTTNKERIINHYRKGLLYATG